MPLWMAFYLFVIQLYLECRADNFPSDLVGILLWVAEWRHGSTPESRDFSEWTNELYVDWPLGHCCFYITGCAMSGLIADAKTLIDKARVETQVKLASSLLFTVVLEFLFSVDIAVWAALQVSVLTEDIAPGH